MNPGEQLVATLNGQPLNLNGVAVTQTPQKFFQLTGQDPGAGHRELYPFTLASRDNILAGSGYPDGSTGALVEEGYWVGLAPLQPGTYTLEFGGLDKDGKQLFGGIDTITVDPPSVFADASVAPTVPEPSTWTMMLLGFAGLGYTALRRGARRKPEGAAAG